MIIGLVGFIGSGKGTVGDMLRDTYEFRQRSFAAALKDATASVFGWNRRMLEGDTKDSREWRETPDPWWSAVFGRDFTPREALQKMGTESCRDVFNPDIWLHRLARDLNQNKHGDYVITDVRFPNEIDYIRSLGGVIVEVYRGVKPIWYDALINSHESRRKHTMSHFNIHESEWAWVCSKRDYKIQNDGTLEELTEKVEKLINCLTNVSGYCTMFSIDNNSEDS